MSANWADDESSEEGDIEPEIEIPVPKVEAPVQAQPLKQRRDDNQHQQHHRQHDRRQETFTAPYLIEVSNLKYNIPEADVGNFFASGGCQVKDVILGAQQGTATVEFENESSLVRSREAHNAPLQGRDIRIRVVNNNRRGGDRNNRGDNRGDRGGRGGRGDDRGRDHRGPPRDGSSSAVKGKEEEKDWSRKNAPGGKAARPAAPAPMVTTASTASVRPSLNLTPRSLPVDAAANTPSSSSSIFGSGKAREEPPAAEVKSAPFVVVDDGATADAPAAATTTADSTASTATKPVKSSREPREGQSKTVFNKAINAATKQPDNRAKKNTQTASSTTSSTQKGPREGGRQTGGPRQSNDYSRADGKKPIVRNNAKGASKGKEEPTAEQAAAAAAKEAARILREQEKAKPVAATKSANAFAALGMDEDE